MARPRADSITVATTERILDAAVLEFATRGYGEARLADIAAAAGITRPSLLYHYSSKTELYAATLARAASLLAEMILRAVGSHGAFRDRLHFLVQNFVEFADETPAVCRLLLRVLIADDAAVDVDADRVRRGAYKDAVAPLVDDVVAFIEREGAEALRPGVPLRAALMSVVVTVLTKSAAGALRPALWGLRDHHDEVWLFVEHALLRPDHSSPHAPRESPARHVRQPSSLDTAALRADPEAR